MTRMMLEDDIAWIIHLVGELRDQVIQLEKVEPQLEKRFPEGHTIVHLWREDGVPLGQEGPVGVSVHVPSGHVQLALQLAARGYPTMRYEGHVSHPPGG